MRVSKDTWAECIGARCVFVGGGRCLEDEDQSVQEQPVVGPIATSAAKTLA